MGPLHPDELAEGDQLQEANRPVALGELTSLTSLHLTECSTYIAEELGMKLEGLARTVPWLVRVTHTITRTTPLKAHS